MWDCWSVSRAGVEPGLRGSATIKFRAVLHLGAEMAEASVNISTYEEWWDGVRENLGDPYTSIAESVDRETGFMRELRSFGEAAFSAGAIIGAQGVENAKLEGALAERSRIVDMLVEVGKNPTLTAAMNLAIATLLRRLGSDGKPRSSKALGGKAGG